MNTATYEVARNAAIILKTSVSLLTVSSNPGVSIKTTRRPSKLKTLPGCTLSVQDWSPWLTARLDPLMRLMNCTGDRGQKSGRHLMTAKPQKRRLTVDLPVPVAPITLSSQEDRQIVAKRWKAGSVEGARYQHSERPTRWPLAGDSPPAQGPNLGPQLS